MKDRNEGLTAEQITYAMEMDEIYYGKIRPVFIAKRGVYSDEPIEIMGELGIVYFCIAKIIRAKNILIQLARGKPTGETTDDSWIDMIVYGLLALRLKGRGGRLW